MTTSSSSVAWRHRRPRLGAEDSDIVAGTFIIVAAERVLLAGLSESESPVAAEAG